MGARWRARAEVGVGLERGRGVGGAVPTFCVHVGLRASLCRGICRVCGASPQPPAKITRRYLKFGARARGSRREKYGQGNRRV